MSDFLTPTNSKELFSHYSISLLIPELDLFKTEEHIVKNESFSIDVITMTGKKINITINPLDTVYHIKQLIHKEDNILINQQRLVFNHKQLEDESIVKDIGITTNSTLYLILRLRGGMFHSTSSRNDYLSLEFIIKREKAFAMIRHMRDKYDFVVLMDDIHAKLIKCYTDDDLDQLFVLIEKYYIA